eukprot:TRINITY_DN2289_c0_g2_i1.p1 TRINITY_DN2289_c0_g2~~TRINITY_DN2289_c0_g2_i1.p1  ORF type:complete len:362 (+),score=41.89 TRINITY_DN2289_c0_g2_i1:146-1231(+)
MLVMSQQQLYYQPHHHHQQHPHQPPVTLMGEQTQPQIASTQTQPPLPSPPPPPPPPPPQLYQDQQQQQPPPPNSPSSSSSKIPFRPKKIRKLSSSTKQTPNSSLHLITVKKTPTPPPLISRTLSSEGEIAIALRHLRSADPHLARVIDLHEPPSFQHLHPPFHSLARSILYQQLAFKAAASIYSRFLSLCGGESNVVPEAVLSLTPHQLRQIGVSGRKATYLHDLASKYQGGILSDSAIVTMDDKSLFSMLTMVKGIGAWSVHMFMIFSLHRPDVLPVGDLGVRKGVQLLYGLDQLPRPSQMEQLCERWRPYRSVGSWYMWRLMEGKTAPAAPATAASPVSASEQQRQLLDPVLNGLNNIG